MVLLLTGNSSSHLRPTLELRVIQSCLILARCGLHVVHGAFQAGHDAVGWIVSETLRDTYGLFKDNPACRTDYTVATSSTCIPKKILSDSLCGKFRCCCQNNRNILACEEICGE